MALTVRGVPPIGDGRGQPLEVAAYCAKLLPGVHVGLYYRDDPRCVHERILLWPAAGSKGVAGGRYWAVRTPDGDVYVEDVTGITKTGASIVTLLTTGRNPPTWASGHFYRFAEKETDANLAEWIEEGRKSFDTDDFKAKEQPEEILDVDNAKVPFYAVHEREEGWTAACRPLSPPGGRRR